MGPCTPIEQPANSALGWKETWGCRWCVPRQGGLAMEEEEEARKPTYLKLPEPAARMPRIAPMMEAAEIKPPVSGADDERRTHVAAESPAEKALRQPELFVATSLGHLSELGGLECANTPHDMPTPETSARPRRARSCRHKYIHSRRPCAYKSNKGQLTAPAPTCRSRASTTRPAS